MTNGVEVRVEGLNQLRNALRLIEPNLQKNLRKRFRTVADKVAARARSKMPRRSGKAQGSVRGGASSTTAYVITGKATVPYTPWLDFGGRLHPVGGRRNGQEREQIKEGRYLYPAIREMQPQVEREAVQAIDATARELGL